MSLDSIFRTRGNGLGLNPQRLQREFVCHRLLARLLVVAPDRWALKGGLALDFRLGAHARGTRDMDLLWLDSAAQATQDLLDAQMIELGDHFAFHISMAQHPGETGERATRYHVSASLASRRYVEVTIDVGLSDELVWPSELVPPPDYLRVPGVEPSPVPTLPIEQHIAEKLHAYTQEFKTGPNSRTKDLVDLVLIATFTSPDARRLQYALERIFAGRNSHVLPAKLPTPPQGWEVPYQRMAVEIGIDPDVLSGYRTAAALLDPVLGDAPPSGVWLPSEGRWS